MSERILIYHGPFLCSKFIELRWEVGVCFVDIGGIDDMTITV